jgi:hypothetical protein
MPIFQHWLDRLTHKELHRLGLDGLSSGGGGGVTDHGALTGLSDDDHPQYTTTAEATTLAGTAVTTHEAAADPHTGYATDTDLSNHAAAADPHTGYQKESEKDVANGYAGLNASGVVPDARIDAAIARDSEVTSAVAAHAGAADPHAGYVLESLVDAKGDLVAGTADNTVGRLPAGTNGQILTAQSAQATGLQWATHDNTGDPHSQYATDTDLSTHAGAADPHTGYVLESLFDAKGDLLAATADNTPGKLTAGTNGQFLTAQSAQATGLQWATHDNTGDPHSQYATDADLTNHAAAADPHTGYVLESLIDAKGDLFAGSADNTVARLAVGTDGQVLTADSAQATGVKWATAAAGGSGDIDIIVWMGGF